MPLLPITALEGVRSSRRRLPSEGGKGGDLRIGWQGIGSRERTASIRAAARLDSCSCLASSWSVKGTDKRRQAQTPRTELTLLHCNVYGVYRGNRKQVQDY
jgi:hypothetical protein